MSPHVRITELLSNLPLFRNLNPPELEHLAQATRQIRVPKHDLLFRRGEPSTGLFVVAVGRIKLAIPSARGQEKVVEFFGPGECFGEAMMFLDRPFLVEAQALEDTLVIWVDKTYLFDVLDHDPSLARRMLAGLSLRLHTLVRDIETISLQNAVQRVAGYLLSHPAPSSADGGQATFSCNKNLIASKLGLTPETLSRVLHQLGDAGLITVQGRDVAIHDPETLRREVFAA